MLGRRKNSIMLEKTFCSLGTINNIKVWSSKKENIVEGILQKAVQRVNEIDDRMSAFKENSDISTINRNAGCGYVKIHKDTFELLEKAKEYGDLSNGTFDITMRPLIVLWGINKKGSFIPSELEIQEFLELVSYRDILLDSKSCAALLKKAGQALDLGGIAKGYAADEVKRILKKNGIKSALINLGGNVVAMGKREDGQAWQIGIQNPLSTTGHYLGAVSVKNKTIVTSGSNERFFIKEGIRYHHILDPRIGKPAQSGLLSVTVICNSSIDADAVTTAFFILGPEKSEPLLNRIKGQAIFVKEDLSIVVSQGLELKTGLENNYEKYKKK